MKQEAIIQKLEKDKSKSELIEGTMSVTSSVEGFTHDFVGGLFGAVQD